MSALPQQPGHFVDWLRREVDARCRTRAGSPPAHDYGRYLDDALSEVLQKAPGVTLERRCCRVASVRPVPGGVHLALADGSSLQADAAVLAPGIFAPGVDWAPQTLRSSSRFVADPWAPGALAALRSTDGDVLLVGTGLTTVDLALTLARPGRTLYAVSRRGRLPTAHTTRPKPPTPAPPREPCPTTQPAAPRPTPTACAPSSATLSPPPSATAATGGRPSTPCVR